MSGLTVSQKQLRLGYFNASTVEALLKPKGLGDGGMTYIYKKAAERDTGELQDIQYTSPEMQWGIDFEEKAINCISQKVGIELIKNDDILFDDTINLSGTPDVMAGYEIKCPSSAKHLFYRSMKTGEDLKKIAPNYYWQCVAYMFLTGLSSWIFCSYDPRNKGKELFMLEFSPLVSELEFFNERLSQANEILKSI